MVPDDPQIFHITHRSNLASIVEQGGLWCDSKRIARNLKTTNIGHLHIKERRLKRAVPTSGGGHLGDYVPFNFCPRSVMLFVVDRGHQDYTAGQADIVHLVSSVSRAATADHAWAFTDRHAELQHALYYEDLAELGEVSWGVMGETYWSAVKEERQAEFLVKEFFPWSLFTEIGVMSQAVQKAVRQALAGADAPPVTIHRDWYS